MIRSPRRDMLGTLLCETISVNGPDGQPTVGVVIRVDDVDVSHRPNRVKEKKQMRILKKDLREGRAYMRYGPFDPYW